MSRVKEHLIGVGALSSALLVSRTVSPVILFTAPILLPNNFSTPFIKIYSILLLLQGVAASLIFDGLANKLLGSDTRHSKENLFISFSKIFFKLYLPFSLFSALILSASDYDFRNPVVFFLLIAYTCSYSLVFLDASLHQISNSFFKATLGLLYINIIVPFVAYSIYLFTASVAFYLLSLCLISLLYFPFVYFLFHSTAISLQSDTLFQNTLNPLEFSFKPLALFSLNAFISWLSGYGIVYFASETLDPVDLRIFTFSFSIANLLGVVSSCLCQTWLPIYQKKLLLYKLRSLLNLFFFFLLGIVIFLLAVLLLNRSDAILYYLFVPEKSHIIYFRTLIVILSSSFIASLPWYYSINSLITSPSPKYITFSLVLSAVICYLVVPVLFRTLLNPYLPALLFLSLSVSRSIFLTAFMPSLWINSLVWIFTAVLNVSIVGLSLL
jgi:hypothetical protein